MSEQITEQELEQICTNVKDTFTEDFAKDSNISDENKCTRFIEQICESIRGKSEMPRAYPAAATQFESRAILLCNFCCPDFHPQFIVEKSLREVFGEKVTAEIKWPRC